ncbi:MAG: hypothetical protein FD153_1747 [Rhodospirillaceae bacterium]|nr:MAG: hypothetical protein FD153_1747 [Rhodospirillaceae bacterium]
MDIPPCAGSSLWVVVFHHQETVARVEARLQNAIENLAEAFVLWGADNRLILYNGSGDGIMVPSLTFAEVLRRARRQPVNWTFP